MASLDPGSVSAVSDRLIGSNRCARLDLEMEMSLNKTQHTLPLHVSPPRLVFNCWSGADATFKFAAKPCWGCIHVALHHLALLIYASLSVQPTCVAHVLLSDVVVKARFIVSNVPSPWVALGALLRSGWGVVHENGSPFRGEKKLWPRRKHSGTQAGRQTGGQTRKRTWRQVGTKSGTKVKNKVKWYKAHKSVEHGLRTRLFQWCIEKVVMLNTSKSYSQAKVCKPQCYIPFPTLPDFPAKQFQNTKCIINPWSCPEICLIHALVCIPTITQSDIYQYQSWKRGVGHLQNRNWSPGTRLRNLSHFGQQREQFGLPFKFRKANTRHIIEDCHQPRCNSTMPYCLNNSSTNPSTLAEVLQCICPKPSINPSNSTMEHFETPLATTKSSNIFWTDVSKPTF